MTPARSRMQEGPKAHLAGSAQRRRCTRYAQGPWQSVHWTNCLLMPPRFVVRVQAAQLGHTAVVRMLLQPRAGRRVDANAGLSAGPFGLLATESPLAVAAAHGHIETVLALLEAAGAQPDLGWSAGHGVGCTSSPLAYAVDRGHDGVIRALLARGARPDLGRTVGPGALRTPQHPCLSGSYMTTSVGAPGLSRCVVGLVYLSTPLYNAARDDLPSAVAALLALPDTDGRDESGRDQSTAQCTWAPAGAGLLSGALMGYCGA